MHSRILIVADDDGLGRSLVACLEARRLEAVGVGTVAEARALLEGGWGAAVVDMTSSNGDGLELLGDARRCRPPVPVIVASACASIEHAVEAMRRGAVDYLSKPIAAEELAARVERLVRAPRAEGRGFELILGRSPAMLDAIESARRVARSDAATVLLTGESGTGKDLLAHAIHEESPRALGPFVSLACTAVSEALLESELFGHEKNSPAGAPGVKRGVLEMADGGTVFLDEVGDIRGGVQAKLLRFLEDGSMKRVGGARDIAVSVRLIAATSRRLSDRVAEGVFRGDLHHRLAVIEIELPPLRFREGDIALLAHSFVAELGGALGSPARSLAPEALERLERYAWPGNVRELRSVIERALILCRGPRIEARDLPAEIRAPFRALPHLGARGAETNGCPIALPDGGLDLETVERDLLLAALARANGNKTAAGRLLGLNRDQVRYRLKKLRENPRARGA